MTDNLTNRIAAAIRAVDDMRVCKLSDADIKFIAAATVEELGLRRVNKVRSYGLGPNGVVDRACHRRYVTEWEADE